MHADICMDCRGLQMDIVFPRSLFTHILGARVSGWPWSSLIQLGWLPSELEASTYVHPTPRTRVPGTCYYTWYFKWVLGIQIQDFVLAWLAFSWLTRLSCSSRTNLEKIKECIFFHIFVKELQFRKRGPIYQHILFSGPESRGNGLQPTPTIL